MARTIEQIQTGIFDSITANPNLAGLSSASNVAIYRLMVFIVSYAILLLETLFDTHKKEVDDIILQKIPGTARWYRTMSLKFQYGFALLMDTDQFDNTGATQQQIDDSKIIKYCAVTEVLGTGRLVIKIATETAGVLSPIQDAEKTAFDAYVKEFRYAGVRYRVVNYLPDILILTLKIYRDPLVLDSNGMSILNANYPVEDAIKQYFKELPFDGELVLAHLVDKLQLVEGVVIPHIINAETKSIDPNTDIYGSAQPLDVKTIPVSGYFTIENFDNVTYVV